MLCKLLILLFVCSIVGEHSATGKTQTGRTNDQSSTDAWIRKTLNADRAKKCLTVSSITSPKQIESSWMIAILGRKTYPDKIVYTLNCTGSLIHPKVVLAAAHCFPNNSTGGLVAIAGAALKGAIDSTRLLQERLVERIVVHENFRDDSVGNDVALVFVNNNFTKKNGVKTVCLPNRAVNPENVRCSFTGFHLSNKTGPVRRQIIKHSAKVNTRIKCERVLRTTGLGKSFEMTHDMLCVSGVTNKTSMSGYGGSPLACSVCNQRQTFVQVGLLSFGFDVDILPDVVTSLMPHLKWIRTKCRTRGIRIRNCFQQNRIS